jgi:hypothetical protein
MRMWRSKGWGRTSKPHLLVEDPSVAYDHAHFDAFQRAGFEVARCSGPDAQGGCVRLTRDSCPLAARADLIVWGLDLSLPEHRQVLHQHESRHLGTPVVFFTDPGGAGSSADQKGLHPRATSVGGQVRILQAALADVWWANSPMAAVSTWGPVSSTERRYAQHRLGQLDLVDPEVRVVRVELVRETDPVVERPALARATLEIDGRVVHVHAGAATMRAAIDDLEARGRARISELATR